MSLRRRIIRESRQRRRMRIQVHKARLLPMSITQTFQAIRALRVPAPATHQIRHNKIPQLSEQLVADQIPQPYQGFLANQVCEMADIIIVKDKWRHVLWLPSCFVWEIASSAVIL